MNLGNYFERIGFDATPRVDLETLRALHRLHPCAIPFENLSTLLGEPVPLDIDRLEDKLVTRRRGGYCFEQNALFGHVLESIGFALTPLAARVVWNLARGRVNPRTHMALMVELDGQRLLCDVGFGGVTLTAPLTIDLDVEQVTPHEPFRIEARDGEFELQVRLGETWRSTYQFDLQAQRAIDYEPPNYYVAAHPDSHFRRILMAGRPDSTGRHALNGNCLSRYESGTEVDRRTIRTAEGLKSVLDGTFGIALPDHPGLGMLLERIADAGSV